MNFLTLFLFLFTSFIPAFSQSTFFGIYGTNQTYFSACAATRDNGMIITGSVENGGNSTEEICVIKLDSNGTQEWSKLFGDTGRDVGQSVIEIENKSYVICGLSENNGYEQNLLVFKIDSAGNIVWKNVYSSSLIRRSAGYCIKQISDGFIVVGQATKGGSPMTFHSEIIILKLNSVGDVVWSHVYGTPNDEYASYVSQTQNGGYIVSATDGSGNAVFPIRIDSLGNIVWSKRYGGPLSNLRWIAESPDNDFFLVGMAAYNVSDVNAFVIRIDSSGNPYWTKLYGGPSFDYFYSADFSGNNEIIAVGFTNSSGRNEILAMRINANGDTLWTRSFHDSLTSSAQYVALSPDGGFAIVGSDGNIGCYLKLDSMGNSYCFQQSPVIDIQSIQVVSANKNYNYHDINVFNNSTSSIQEISAGNVFNICSPITNKPEDQQSGNSKIYPNPATDYFIIQSSNPLKEVELFNKIGMMISRHTVSSIGNIKIQTEGLANGMYYIKFSNDDSIEIRKLLIHK